MSGLILAASLNVSPAYAEPNPAVVVKGMTCAGIFGYDDQFFFLLTEDMQAVANGNAVKLTCRFDIPEWGTPPGKAVNITEQLCNVPPYGFGFDGKFVVTSAGKVIFSCTLNPGSDFAIIFREAPE
ncbi:hypothetical protein [Sphingomicrobium clamense]|uniref:Uncharacterized protein n=1 Tax=Sphingomicrobium clamense TaxID=2851013 RepID=A0ABS6V3T4_9SPHN|nr:hypothetical protein [Sphingomicrobium sp. B8]MBW0144204.1 hypothetical protein [Sphingomicrobium sp. B8]